MKVESNFHLNMNNRKESNDAPSTRTNNQSRRFTLRFRSSNQVASDSGGSEASRSILTGPSPAAGTPRRLPQSQLAATGRRCIERLLACRNTQLRSGVIAGTSCPVQAFGDFLDDQKDIKQIIITRQTEMPPCQCIPLPPCCIPSEIILRENRDAVVEGTGDLDKMGLATTWDQLPGM